MRKWLRRIGGAVGMGLAWAVAWGPIAVLTGMLVDRDGSMDEPWAAIGAFPGFLCGVVFVVVLGIAEAHRRLGDISLSGAAIWGAVAGLLVAVLPLALGEPTGEVPLWLLSAAVIASITLLSAVSAAGSAALARYAARKRWTSATSAPPPRSA